MVARSCQEYLTFLLRFLKRIRRSQASPMTFCEWVKPVFFYKRSKMTPSNSRRGEILTKIVDLIANRLISDLLPQVSPFSLILDSTGYTRATSRRPPKGSSFYLEFYARSPDIHAVFSLHSGYNFLGT